MYEVILKSYLQGFRLKEVRLSEYITQLSAFGPAEKVREIWTEVRDFCFLHQAYPNEDDCLNFVLIDHPQREVYSRIVARVR